MDPETRNLFTLCFTVTAGQVHQLENTGSLPLNALFGCPPSHLTSDRTVLGGSR